MVGTQLLLKELCHGFISTTTTPSRFVLCCCHCCAIQVKLCTAVPLVCQCPDSESSSKIEKQRRFNAPVIQLQLFELMLAEVSLSYYVFPTQWTVSCFLCVLWLCVLRLCVLRCVLRRVHIRNLWVPVMPDRHTVRLPFSAGAWNASQSENSSNHKCWSMRSLICGDVHTLHGSACTASECRRRVWLLRDHLQGIEPVNQPF